MSKMNGFIAALFAIASVPAVSHADDIRVSSYEMSDTGGTVLLESTTEIGEPWMRIDGKSIRVWFPRITHVARFDHARDAEDPIRGLNLRPGADDSAVLRLDLGTGRKVTRDDIEVVRTGLTARVQVRFEAPVRPARSAVSATPAPEQARPLLQPSAAGKPVPGPIAGKNLQAPGAAVVSPVAPSVQAAPKTSQAAASYPSARAAAGTSVSASSGGSAIRSLAQAADGKQATQLGLASGSGANIGGLVLLSGILCGVYLGIRAYGKKRTKRSPEIQVISARRLGHRSEVLVVRALGADHLLVTSAGRVERVASVPTPVEPEPQPEPQPEPPLAAPAAPNAVVAASSQVSGLGIISHLSSSYRVRKLLDTVDKEAPAPAGDAPATAPAHRPSFGPELLSAMNQHRLANLSSIQSPANKQSDAVAGIARLRAGAGSGSAN